MCGGRWIINSFLDHYHVLLNYRDVDLTEKLDYSSAVAILGYSLILAILRSLNVREDAVRVMVAAPLLAFVTTHILYLNFYKLDYGMFTFPFLPFYFRFLSNE